MNQFTNEIRRYRDALSDILEALDCTHHAPDHELASVIAGDALQLDARKTALSYVLTDDELTAETEQRRDVYGITYEVDGFSVLQPITAPYELSGLNPLSAQGDHDV